MFPPSSMYVHAERPVTRRREARTTPTHGAKLTSDQDVHEPMTHQHHAAVILGAGNEAAGRCRGTFPRGLEALDTG